MNPLICLAACGLLAIQPPSQLQQAKRPDRQGGPTASAVSRRVFLAVGSTVPLQMSSKRPIRTVLNENEQVARVQSLPNDPTTVLVTGLSPGRARITLIDADGKAEVLTPGKPEKRR